MLTLISNIYAKKRNFLLFLACGALLFSNSAVSQSSLGVKTVVIDAGHGGKDPGAVGPSKIREKDVVLNVTLLLGDMIKKNYPDVNVIYTRSTDVFIGLNERAKIANRNKADLFISIHANAAGNINAHGFESWVLGLHKSAAALEVAKFENSSILMEEGHEQKYESFDPNDPDAYIALSMRQNAFLEQSLALADLFQKNAVGDLKRKNRGVRQAGFLVLYKTTMPSVLVELGFLSNKPEEQFLASESGQEKLAKEMYDAFSQYKKQIEKVDESIGDGGSSSTHSSEVKEQPKEEQPKEIKEVKEEEKPNEKGIVFKVQIASSSVKMETIPANFKGLKDVDSYLSGSVYKYTVGKYSNLKQAKERQDKVREEGYETAFVIAFENGERIGVQEAINKLNH